MGGAPLSSLLHSQEVTVSNSELTHIKEEDIPILITTQFHLPLMGTDLFPICLSGLMLLHPAEEREEARSSYTETLPLACCQAAPTFTARDSQ